MILNVSGRTDIVAFYTKWFMNRYHEGFVDVRNPFRHDLVSRIYFKDVDLIVFCTKNPIPILDKLKEIKKPIIFQVTLTPYMDEIEEFVPSKKSIIDAIKKLSDIIGIDNLYVRYDPVFLSKKYNIPYHKKMFERMCNQLDGYVDKIIISFLDEYKNVNKNKSILKNRTFSEEDFKEIGLSFSNSAKKHNMTVQTCFEEKTLIEYGFIEDVCVSREKAFKLTKKPFKKWKARGCNCAEMVDIGVYNSCKHFCKYCYANYDEKRVKENYINHDVNSSLLIGRLNENDTIKVRTK